MTKRETSSLTVGRPFSRRVRASEWSPDIVFFEIMTRHGIATGWKAPDPAHTTIECAMHGRLHTARWDVEYSIRRCVTLADRWMAELAAGS